MTPQEVIKQFMAGLNANDYSYSAANGKQILNDAVQASSDFADVQAVIDQMLTDRDTAEREAIKYVLGDKYDSSYDGKQLSQISLPSMTWDEVKDKTAFGLNDTYGSYFYEYGNITLANIIKENTANIFLQKYCGIQLNTNYVVDPASGYGIDGLTVNGEFISNKSLETPNVDTGAITGSDANITLTAGDVVNGTTLAAANLSAYQNSHADSSSLSADGQTLIIGTGVEKTERSVVPESGDMYLFTATGDAKNINTGSNGWIVNATSGDDTITTGGRDSVNAGSGNDSIEIGADEATVTTGNGSDTVEIAENVNSVTVTDLNSSDTIKISGTFEVGNAKLENSMLVVTDKTGTRKIKFSDLTNAAQAKIGAQTISQWLADAGFNVNSLSSGDIADFDATGVIEIPADGRVAVDSDYKPTPLDIANHDSVDQTQTVSSATNIDLDDVTITSGTVKSGSSTVGTVSSVTPAVTNFTTRGLTVHVGDGTATSYSQLTSGQKSMVAALFKWWADECLQLNEDSYDFGFTSDTAKVTDITLSFENLGDNTLALVQYGLSTYGTVTNITELKLKISTAYYSDFSADDTDGTSTVDGAGFLDRTLAHEFTHAVMVTNNINAANLPQFIMEGMAELTHGIDDERGNLIFKLAYDASELTSALNVNNTSTGDEECYAGGYMFLRYLAKQAALQSLDLSATDTTPATSDIFTEGDDTYNNTVDGATILALGGNDSITNNGSDVSIDGGASDDYISNNSSNVTINGGAGNDSIINSIISNGDSVKIDGGAGNDSIYNDGSDVSINGGDGNDSIENNDGSNVTIDGGASDDYIYNNSSNVTINGGAGNDEIINSGDSVSIEGGAGDDTIYNDGGASVTIDGGDGKDYIDNSNDSVTIDGGAGNDSIDNYASNVTISGGDGDDSTRNDYGTNVSISGGKGNDYFHNNGASVIIDGGDGNDTISNAASNVTISGDGGNDSISLDASATDNLIQYADGDGNDTVTGLNATSTLKIGDGTGTYSKATVDNDIIVKVGDGSVKLVGAAILDAVNIAGTDKTPAEESPLLITLTTGNDSHNNTLDGVVLLALAGGDSVTNSGANVTINADAGNDRITNSGANVSISAGDGNDTIINYSSNVSINGGTGNDSISLGDSATGNLIQYTNGDGNDTVTGFNGDDTLQIGGGTGTYSTQQSGSDIIVTVGDGSILLVGAASLDAVNISGTEDESSAADNWTFADGVAKYKNLFTLTGINPNLTVDELDAAINIDGNKIILTPNALAQANVTLTTTGDYTLALDDDCPTVTTVAKSWTLDGTTATYHDTGKSDGYTLTDSKTVTYTTATGGNVLLTVNGVVENISEDDLSENLTVSGKVLTVTPEVVGDNFSVSGGYKVVFATGDYGNSTFTGTTGKDTIEVDGNGLKISLGAGNDTITSNGDGNVYLFDANGGKDVVKGFGDDDTIKITDGSAVTASVKGSDIIVKAGSATMTLKNAATGTHLNVVDSAGETLIDETVYSDRIVVDDGATLLSAFSSSSFAAEDPIVKVDGSAVTRKFSLTGGEDNNTLIGGTGANFINGVSGENILTGGKGNDTFAVGNGVDTITDYGVGTDKISLAADVTDFAIDGDDVIISFDDDKSMTIADGAGKKIYFLQNGKSSTDIFGAGGKMNTAKTSITLSAATDDYTAASTIITINGSLTEGVNIVGNAKNNKIFGGDGDDTLNGGTKNATLTGGDGNDIFVYETGKIVISDYVSGEDRISLTASPTSESLKSNGDVVLKFDSTNQLTIKGGDEIVFVTDSGEVTKTYFSEKIVGDDGVTLTSSFTGNFTADGKVDASSNTKKITLTGGDDSDTLIGGKGTNVLNGNGGDDILIGNGGADTFVYSSGDDTITDYESKDKISLTSAIADFTIDGDDVIISFGDGSLTISDAANSAISFVETTNGKVTTNVNIFAESGIFNKLKTAVTLNAATESYTAPTNIVSIDGGLATDAVEIVGNSKANKIHAGNNGSTIDGGNGSDSLWGGDGSDTFIYSGGKDVIYNFGDGDALNFNGDFTASVKNGAISFKVGSTANAVTLKDFTAKEFNVNGDTYTITNGNFTRK